MNIVIFTDTYLPKIDGVAISVDQFTRILSEKGHKFVICAPEYGEETEAWNAEGIEVIRFKSAPLPSYPDIKVALPSQKRLYRAMVEFKPDLVHIQTPGLLGHYGVAAARLYGIPLIGTYHTLVNEQDTYLSLYRLLKVDQLVNYFRSTSKQNVRLDRIERKPARSIKKHVILRITNSLYQAGKLIISPSEMIKKELENSGVKRPIYVVSNGMDLDRFSGTEKHRQDRPLKLLHVGRISYEKNCHILLKAFALLKEEFPDAKLDIIGDGPALASLKIEAAQLGIEKSMQFPGFIPHEKLPEVYPEYDIFLTASTMETQGLVVLEAIASGLPCVGVDAYALPELIQNERNGFIVEPFNHIALARKVLEIWNDPELYRRFSIESLVIAGSHDLRMSAEKLESVYRIATSKGDDTVDSHQPIRDLDEWEAEAD